MNTRSSSAKKKKDCNAKFSFPASKALGYVTNTVESIVSNAQTADTVTSTTGVVLGDDESHLVKARPSILVALDNHKDDPTQIYWESKEARNLFRPIGNETVIKAIENQIQLLVSAFNGNNNWKTIVGPKADVHKEFYLVPGSVADLREEALVLSVALDIAKRDKPAKTWAICCEEAVTLIYGQDGENNLIASAPPPTSAKVQEWYREFRENRFFLSKKKRYETRKEKRDGDARLKKELEAVKKENAVLRSKLEYGLPQVKTGQEAANLLAEIERDMANVKIED